MTKLLFLVLTGLASPLAAEPVRFDDLDINVDGRLELSELTLAFGPRAPGLLAALDADGDGAVTVYEVQNRSAARPQTGDTGQSARFSGSKRSPEAKQAPSKDRSGRARASEKADRGASRDRSSSGRGKK